MVWPAAGCLEVPKHAPWNCFFCFFLLQPLQQALTQLPRKSSRPLDVSVLPNCDDHSPNRLGLLPAKEPLSQKDHHIRYFGVGLFASSFLSLIFFCRFYSQWLLRYFFLLVATRPTTFVRVVQKLCVAPKSTVSTGAQPKSKK